MHTISSSTGSVGHGETSWEDGNSAEIVAKQNADKELINKANSVPLNIIFKYYKLRLNLENRKIICPFKFHKGGREGSPSFTYYPNTNSFYCYGCSSGGPRAHGCEFVSLIDNVNVYKAARKIYGLFGQNINDYDDSTFLSEEFNSSEYLETIVEFSNIIREYLHSNNNKKTLLLVDNICKVYDDLYMCYNSNDSIKHTNVWMASTIKNIV